MIKIFNLTSSFSKFTLPQILLASLLVATPIQISTSSLANATGSCDSNGTVTTTTSGGFVTVKYTLTTSANNAGTTSSCTYTVPAGVTQVEFLVVGGGGGGGGGGASTPKGGGGGGGVIHIKNFITTPGASMNVSIGAGGGQSGSTGLSGSGSSFAGKSVGGGGGGGSGDQNGGNSTNGSGGGAGANSSGSTVRSGGTSSSPSGVFPNQFFASAGGGGASTTSAFGGGGAGQVAPLIAGSGGYGYIFDSVGYAGGGGGGKTGSNINGADAGGGFGGNATFAGIAGTNGGGGGGGTSTNGGRGGAGVVIVRYQTCTFSSPTNYSTGVGSNYKFLVRATASDSNSSCTSNWSVPTGVTEVEVFVLGGGGGGGGKLGGGGGSGGAILQTSYSIGSDTSIAVTVGGGGHGGYGGINDSAGYGDNSVFGSLTAYGGGYGGDEVGGVSSGRNGGSGGGANGGGGAKTIGTATQAFGTGTKYGTNGGAGSGGAIAFGAGGGGGLGGAGGSGSSTNGGAGGVGITQYGVNLGGGGGGGVNNGTAGTAATYGGGAGGSSGNGSNATASTGGGGGGGRNSVTAYGGSGGSGTIFILYHQNLEVTFDANGGVGAPTAQSIQSGVAFNLTNSVPTRAGYVFKRWNTESNRSGVDYESGSSNIRSTNLTLYADWEAKDYVVSYVYNGATQGNTTLSSTYKSGTTAISLPSPLKTDYIFAGWYLEADFKTLIGSAGASYAPNTSQTAITLYARWSQYTYSIKYFDSNSGSGGGADGGTEPSRQDGTSVTSVNLSANTLALSGYTFSGWATSNGSTSVVYADSATINITSNTTLNLYPVWSGVTYTVTYNYNGATGGSNTVSSAYTYGGAAITLPTPTRTGYSFGGWYLDSSLTTSIGSAGAAYSPSGATTSIAAYAKWTGNKIEVSFDLQNGSSGGKTDAFVGSGLSLPTAPTRDGYTFSGWATTSSGSPVTFNPTYTVNQTSNFTLYAIWTADASFFTVTFNSDGGTGSMTPQVANTATNLTLNTFTRSGYIFAGWNTEPFSKGTPYADGAQYAFLSNTTLYATWTYSGYVVSFDTQGGSTLDQVLLNTGSSISLPTEPTKTGSTFSGWSLTSSGSTLTFPYTPATFSDLTLYAIWITAPFNVTFDSNSGTAVASQSTTVGGTLTEPSAPTRSGYTFMGWTTKAGDPAVNFPYTHGASSSFTLYAIWINSYTISFDPQGGDSVSPISVSIGSSTSAPTPPTRANYTFYGWWTEISGGSQIVFPYTPSGNITLRARWVANFFTVTFDAQGGSIVNSLQLSANSLIDTPTASMRSGYTLLGWSLEKGGSLVNFPYNPNNISTQLFAIWQLISNVTVAFESNGGVGSMASQVANTSGTLRVNTFTRSGFSFLGWNTLANGGGTTYLDGATYDFSADLTLYAIWLANAVSPSISDQPQSVTRISGQSVTFSVSATTSDGGELSYQWYIGGAAISGATSSTLSISNLSSGNAGDYTVVVTNSKNSSLATQTSSVATLTVTERTYTVTYTAPDKDGGSVPVDSGGPYTFNTTITLPGNTGSLTRGSYVFAGWRTAADATVRGANSSYSVNEDTTFIAVWSEIYQVSFNANGASGSMSDLNGPSVTIPSSTFTRTGYTFSGWNSSADGRGFPVLVGITVPVTVDVTLYAQWSANTLNITYDANGGTTAAGGSATTTTGSTISTLATSSRSGYTFTGWFTSSSGGTQITTSAAHNQTASFTLYAQWSESSTANVITFTSIANQSYGATLDLSGYVSASSGLTVSLSSATSGVCTISTATVIAIAVGTCTITAAQAGNSSYQAANNVSRSFTVGKKALTITIGNLSATVGGSISDPSYSQSGLVTSFGDAITAPTYKYQGKAGTFYPISTTKPSKLGAYRVSVDSISLSSGSIANYEVTITNGDLTISGVSTNQVSGISIKRSSGDKTTELLTGFNDATTSYSIYLEADISAVTATITRPAGSLITAQIQVNNSGWRRLSFASNVSASGNLPIPVATNTISILTSATDQSNRTFTITIFRDTKSVPSGATSAAPTPTVSPTPATQAVSAVKFYVNNATGIASGAAEVALSPSFSTGTLSYAAAFTNKQSATIMQINFTAAGVNLRLKVNNGPFRVIPALGSSNTIALNVGANTALLRVFSTDGTTVDYTFTLTRAAASP